MSYMDRNQIINESFFKIFEEDNHGTLDEGYWDLFKKFLRGDKQYMKQVRTLIKLCPVLKESYKNDLMMYLKKQEKNIRK